MGKGSFIAVVRRGDIVHVDSLTVPGHAQMEALAAVLKEKAIKAKFFVMRPDVQRFATSAHKLANLLGGTSVILQGLAHDSDDPFNDRLPFPNGWGAMFGRKGVCVVVMSQGGTRMVRCVQSLGKEFGVPLPDIPLFSHQRLGHGFFLDLQQKTLIEI